MRFPRFVVFSSLASVLILLFPRAGLAADDLDNLGSLSQAEFRLLSEDLSAALSYKDLVPAKPLGLGGFDMGLGIIATNLENSELFDRASSDDLSGTVVLPRLDFYFGLPRHVDLSAFVSQAAGTTMKLAGYAVSYAPLEGGLFKPAVAIRATYTKLDGVDDLEISTRSLEVAISKGFANFTPYAGVGRVETDSNPAASTGLLDEQFSQDKVFAGFSLKSGVFNFVLEGDQTGDTTSYSIKLGARF